MLRAWGRGEDGQIGVGDTCDQFLPAVVEGLGGVTVAEIACGSGHTVILSEDGVVYTWGRGDDGRLGHGDSGWKYIPKPVSALGGAVIRHIACGSYHTAAITVDGELFTWGGGMYGKLGHGNENGQSRPLLVHALKGLPVAQVTCGSRHTVALLESGSVYAWGDRENGVCGHGDVDGYQYFPKLVDGLCGQNITQISACGFHTCALSSVGIVYSWGEGKFGRLGHGHENNVLRPLAIEALREVAVVQVSCGGFHTAAVSATGVVFTWGGGEHGQLGHGDKSNKMEPCPISALKTVSLKSVSCGWSHTVGLTECGRVFSWGNGDHGKLGHGDVLKSATPKYVESFGEMKVLRVVSYNEHTVAQLCGVGGGACPWDCRSLSLDMGRLWDSGLFADLTFVTPSQRVPAHRAVLSTRCEHFRAMFESGMKEAATCEILWEAYSVESLRLFLEYLYTDYVGLTALQAVEVFAVADLYRVDALKAICESRVARSLTTDTASELFAKCDDFAACAPLRGMCLRYIVSHFDAVSKTDGFESLRHDLVMEIIRSR